MNNNSNQLVIVCQNIKVNWSQFVNPIYIGVESGSLALIDAKLPFSLVCGDFDSVSKTDFDKIKKHCEKEQIKIIKVDSQKDYLDSELAISTAISLKLKFKQIILITDGFRWDMILAQINFLRKYSEYQPILISQKNYLFSLKESEKHIFSKKQLSYDYISLFTLDEKDVIYNFTGCKYYPNTDIVINNKDVIAISNEFDLENNKNPSIEIKQGNCLVCLVKKNQNQ